MLRALFDGRLPEERPNYEYFGQLLASDGLVAIRPSLCWILVSSSAVRFETDGHRRGEAFKSDGLPLDSRLYPHLGLNLKREEWPERGKIIRGTLLQEYTRALSQKEASCVREISQDWEERFPGPMMNALDGVVREDLRDILHFHVTLDVQEPDRFPEGSELNSLVEVSIEQPGLQNHRWKSVTRLARPFELTPTGTTVDESANSDADEVPVSVITREIGNQYLHRPGCHGVSNGGHCDCFHGARMRRQQLAVPFPAPEWATMLSMLTGYRKHPLEAEGGADGAEAYYTTQRGSSKKSSGSSKRSSYGSTATTATGTTAPRRRSHEGAQDVGDDSFVSNSSAGSNDSNSAPTQMDLVRNIAMLQELWSCDPASQSTSPSPTGSMDDNSSSSWTRRAVIIWTFETVYSVNEKKMEVVKTPAGMGWRFLTTIDPMSQYHQQQALLTPGTKSASAGAPQLRAQAQAHHAHHQQHHNRHHQQHQHQSQQQVHQEMTAYPAGRDSVMSPHPGFHQHLNAAMSEHLSGAAWDPNMAAAMAAASNFGNAATAANYNAAPVYRQQHSISPQAPQQFGVTSPINLLDTSAYSAGLTTPPPTASLSSPYEQPQPHPPHSSQPQVQAGHGGNGSSNPYSHHPQGFQSQMSFMSAASTGSVSSDVENHGHPHGNMHHNRSQQPQPVIDPFLAGTASTGSGQSGPSGGAHGSAGSSDLAEWDAGDMGSLDGWTFGAGGHPQTAAAAPPPPQVGRGQKRGRSDSLDGSSGTGYPVASMPKLNHSGFSNWR